MPTRSFSSVDHFLVWGWAFLVDFALVSKQACSLLQHKADIGEGLYIHNSAEWAVHASQVNADYLWGHLAAGAIFATGCGIM